MYSRNLANYVIQIDKQVALLDIHTQPRSFVSFYKREMFKS